MLWKHHFLTSTKIYKNHCNLYLMWNSFLDVWVLESECLQETKTHHKAHTSGHIICCWLWKWLSSCIIYVAINSTCVHFRASVNGNYDYLMHLVILIVEPLFKRNIRAVIVAQYLFTVAISWKSTAMPHCMKIHLGGGYVVLTFLLLHPLQLFYCGSLKLGWGGDVISCYLSLSKVSNYTKISFHWK